MHQCQRTLAAGTSENRWLLERHLSGDSRKARALGITLLDRYREPPWTPEPASPPLVRRMRGVTLVELLTTVVILAIVCTFGLTAFGDVLARLRVQTALHLISADLAMARSSAIMRRDQVVACPGAAALGCRSDADWSHGWIVFADPDGNRQPDVDSDVIRVADAPSGAPASIRLTSTRAFVRYQRDGRSAGTNLTVNVCHKDTLAGQVVVNNLGRVRSTRPAPQRACPL